MKKNYYSLTKILKENADYNIIIGERSNGKSYALLDKILKDFCNDGKEGVYLRRWKDDILGKRAQTLFSPLVENGKVDEYTKGEWETIIFARGGWYLAKHDYEKQKFVANPTPLCRSLALSDMEHDKSTSYPNVTTIVFDEFLTRRYYLPDEFVIFMNVLSTVIRDRTNVKIFMLGNTVNKFCPYFSEMGLTNVETQLQGTIDVYNFASKLKIAVEYCGESKNKQESNKYFAFDNPRLNMITNGAWELGIYRHLPIGYRIKPKSIVLTCCVEFSSKRISIDVVSQDDTMFLYAHPKTTEPKDDEITYSQNFGVSPYKRQSFMNNADKIDNVFARLYSMHKIFYSSNDVGEILHNFLINTSR